MWPYINQEDLGKPKTLALFLNARGRNLPGVFAMVDMNAFHFGHVTMAIKPAFLNEFTTEFSGKDFPKNYGKIVGWDDDADAFNNMVSGKALNIGEGLLVLEQQE